MGRAQMKSKSIRTARCEDVLDILMQNGKCIFLTLTTPDIVSLFELRKRWRALRHWLIQDVFRGRKVHYVMNFELHPKGHGWHIHAVFNRPIDLNLRLKDIQFYGFGRVDVRLVRSKGVSDYLTKHCLKAYRGIVAKEIRANPELKRIRLVNTSRGLPTLDSYSVHSPTLDKTRHLFAMCRYSDETFRDMRFHDLWRLCELSVVSGDPSVGQVLRVSLDPLGALVGPSVSIYRNEKDCKSPVKCATEYQQLTMDV